MGARKVYDYLINKEVIISLSFVKSVFRSHHLVSRTIKTYKKKKQSHKVYTNKLNRHFEVSESKQAQPRVVCDITEWKLNNSNKIYLCAAIELSTRAVVGYKVDTNSESTLVIDVIQQINQNFPGKNILFHSDQGPQFTSEKVTSKIASLKWTQSMSRKGNCWDNAVIESFFSCIKREELKWHVFHSLEQAERITREYIEGYYMTVRPHESLGGLSPIQYILENQFDNDDDEKNKTKKQNQTQKTDTNKDTKK